MTAQVRMKSIKTIITLIKKKNMTARGRNIKTI